MPSDRNMEAWRPAANAMSEASLETHIDNLCRDMGLMTFHVQGYSPKTRKGWPDRVILAPGRGIMFRENKRQAMAGQPTSEQEKWLNGLASVGLDAGMWAPLDWHSGRITAEVEALARAPKLASAGFVVVRR